MYFVGIHDKSYRLFKENKFYSFNFVLSHTLICDGFKRSCLVEITCGYTSTWSLLKGDWNFIKQTVIVKFNIV